MPVGLEWSDSDSERLLDQTELLFYELNTQSVAYVACTRTGKLSVYMLANSYDSDRATHSVSPPKYRNIPLRKAGRPTW